jgi:hypothetical protein
MNNNNTFLIYLLLLGAKLVRPQLGLKSTEKKKPKGNKMVDG